MRRLFLLVGAFVLVSSVASAQDVIVRADLQSLGLGAIWSVRPVELNGRPGAEWLVKAFLDAFTTTWTVICPSSSQPIAGRVSYNETYETIQDFDGDGRQEIASFDHDTQTIEFRAFPSCRE